MSGPNIVVVVLDCVSASDFPSTGTVDVTQSLFRHVFLNEATQFDRAVAPSCWTIPSHASLLTGLQPWEHQAHSKGAIPLSGRVPLITERLRAAGYRTGLFTANPMIDARSGLDRGFQVKRFATWWEHYLRGLNSGGVSEADSGRLSVLQPAGESLHGKFLSRLFGEISSLNPLLLNLSNVVAQRLREVRPGSTLPSPWIEGQFDAFVKATPTGTPVFSLINFCDAHEPYLLDAERDGLDVHWQETMRIPQSTAGTLLGRRLPSLAERIILHDLYLRSLSQLEERVSSLISTMVDTRRWDDTCFIVTSDHGQNFFGGGPLFHRFSNDDSVLRVPLMVRLPGSAELRLAPSRWTGLVEVSKLAEQMAKLGRSTGSGPPSRDSGVEGGEEGVAFSVYDGLLSRQLALRWLPRPVVDELDRVRVSAYTGESKFVSTAGRKSVQVLSVRTGMPADAARRATAVRQHPTLSTELDAIQTAIGRGPERALTLETSISDRLALWGYT